MKILVTGSAGFIGSAVSIDLIKRGDEVIGIDNHNKYYDPKLKEARLARHINDPNYKHLRINIEDRNAIKKLFEDECFDCVVHLAAQAGVRYSIENPMSYIDTNLVGFAMHWIHLFPRYPLPGKNLVNNWKMDTSACSPTILTSRAVARN